ncbi:MAG: hypothetical protein U0736_28240 [Gemmataceae bacterium]
MAQICELIHRIDVPTPLVLLEVKVLSIDLRDEFTSVFDYQFGGPNGAAGSFSTGDILGAPLGAGFRAALAGTDPTFNRAGSLIFQVVSDSFRFRMQLLEDQNRVTQIATPMVLTANNEVSRIFIGQTQPITVGFNPGTVVANGLAANAVVTPTPITSLQDIGTTLLITPNINADRTVSLRITQQNSNVLPNGGNIPVANTSGGFTNIPIDIVQRRLFSGTIVAKDALTVAIGGLIEEGLNDHRQEVPVLGKIPYLGFFFRRQQTVRTRREQVILVRPYVFFTPIESAALTHDLMKHLSIHPMSPDAMGTLNTFLPHEVLRPNPPQTPLQTIFRVHTITPKDF